MYISSLCIFLLHLTKSFAAPATITARAEPLSSAIPASGIGPQVITVSSTIGSSVVVQTYTAFKFPGYQSNSGTQTITTSNGAGPLLAIILPAGLAWVAALPPGGIVVEPTLPMDGDVVETWSEQQPQQTENPTTTTGPTTTTTATSSTSSTPIYPIETPIVDYVPNDQSYLGIVRNMMDIGTANKLDCGFPKDDEATIDRTTAISMVSDFCNTNIGKTIAPLKMLSESKFYSSGMNVNISVFQVPALFRMGRDDPAITKEDCNHFFTRTIDDCDTKTTTDKLGGTAYNRFIAYQFHPTNHQGRLTCKDTADGTGLSRDEALKIIEEFCTKNDGLALDKDHSPLQHTNKMAEGDSETLFSIKYQESDQCPPGQPAYKVDKNACIRLMSRTIDDCNTNFSPPYGKYGGEIVDYCGVYSLTTQVTEKVYCKTEDPFLGNLARNFDVVEAGKAIEDFCNKQQPDWDPANQPKADQFTQSGQGDYTYTAHANENPGWIIRTKIAAWDPTPADGQCVALSKFTIQGAECKRRLNNILKQCGSNSNGSLLDNSSHGCVRWVLMSSNVATR